MGESIGDKGYPRRHETPRVNDTYRIKCRTNNLGFGSRSGSAVEAEMLSSLPRLC